MVTDDAESAERIHVDTRRRRTPPPVLELVADPAYDLILGLHVIFSAPTLPEIELDREWIAATRAKCPPELDETLVAFFGDEGHALNTTQICGLLYRSPAPLDIPTTLDWLAQLPVHEVLLPLLDRTGIGDDWQVVATSILQSQTGAVAARPDEVAGRIEAFARRYPAAERENVARLLSEPEFERMRLIGALRDWHRIVFASEVPRISSALTREVERQVQRFADAPPAEIFTHIIRGIEYDPPAAIERIVLAPSLMIMPLIISCAVGDTLTYCYPITEAAHSAAELAIMQRRELVRLFEALADDTRLRILQLLAGRQFYLTELSEQLGLTKATTRHHMIRLRAAGLVTLHARDHLSYYSLRREALDEPTKVLQRFLNQKRETN